MTATLTASEDSAKVDLELICDECTEHLCDAESGDALDVLLAVVTDHDRDHHGIELYTTPIAPASESISAESVTAANVAKLRAAADEAWTIAEELYSLGDPTMSNAKAAVSRGYREAADLLANGAGA